MKTLFKNALVFNANYDQSFKNQCVLVENNLIVKVQEQIKDCEADKIIDCKNNVLMPGFVNAHAHSPMTLLRGLCDDENLQTWLFDNMLVAEKKLTEEDIYWGQMLAIAEYVKGGITCVEEMYFFNNKVIEADRKANFRSRVGLASELHLLQSCFEEKDYNNSNALVKPSVSVHSIYTEDEKSIEGFLDVSTQTNLNRAIHLSETLVEVGDCTVQHNQKTPPQYLEDLGFFDKKTLCFHCVHMDKDDLQILADYDVSVATCPSSNIKLASGIAPIYAMQTKGLNITIGTDGAASNNSLDMFKEMFLVATLSKVNIYNSEVVKAKEVLEMATINGAKALDFNCGEIAEGKLADLFLLDITAPHFMPNNCYNTLLSHLVYSAKSSDVYLTMIDGKIVYDNGKFNIGEDIETIYKKVNEIRKRIQK